MFEKEAEEYAGKNKTRGGSSSFGDITNYHDLRKGFKDGAEFGFQKGIKAKINTTTISDCPIRDEWHYVKDGDYPKDNKPVLCILGDVDSEGYEVGYYNDVGSGEPWHFETYHLPDDDGDNAWGVSAWKEIVPPKESNK